MRRDELDADLERTRERGYALDSEEYEPGIVCVAAPILTQDAAAVGAISVSGPAARVEKLGLDALGARLAEHAQKISRELGYTPGAR